MAGALSGFTPTAGGFIVSLYFNVSRNQFNQGAIPGSWYSRTLALIDITYNNVSGACPGGAQRGSEVRREGMQGLPPGALHGCAVALPAELDQKEQERWCVRRPELCLLSVLLPPVLRRSAAHQLATAASC
jgi:hypothetical protein